LRPRFPLRKKRSVQLTIAATALAVPTCAVAIATAAAPPGQSTNANAAASGTSLQLRVSTRRPKYNHPVTVTGTAPISAAGQRVELQAAPGAAGGWRTLQTATVARSGGFSLRAPLTRSGVLRVVQASSLASSVPRPVEVAPQIHVAHTSRSVLGGGRLRVRGRLLPAVGGRVVRLQASAGSGWHTLVSSRTGADGGFRLSSSPDTGLQRRLRVLFSGDATNAPSAQSAGRFTVYSQSVASWYDDSGATACGFHAGYGVANRTLPCGTKVRFRYGGRAVTAVVDDRGPFVGGRDWDLNQNTAGALGFGGVGTVWTSQ
jgi:peptidoglycan lytic transglycosylase